MKTQLLERDTITLTSPDGQFFRRINPDGTFEAKYLGADWKPHDPAFIERDKVAGYVSTMTKRLKWKAKYSI